MALLLEDKGHSGYMKNTISANRLALAGISAAISLGAVIASFYFSQVSISLNIIAAFGIMIPLTKEYYREAILSYVAVCLLGGIFANIHIIPFVMLGGFYTILTIAFHNKKIKLNIISMVIIKILYSCLVFFILYYVTKIFFIDLAMIGIKLIGPWLYIVLNVLFSIVFMLYDILLTYAYKLIKEIVEKIVR